MLRKFWERRPGKEEPSAAKPEKLHGPREIPEEVGRYLVVKLNKNPDWVWRQKAVVRQREGRKGCYNFRVFDHVGAEAKKISIRDYTSLDEHPELVLYEGWFDKNTHIAQVEERKEPHHTPQAL